MTPEEHAVRLDTIRGGVCPDCRLPLLPARAGKSFTALVAEHHPGREARAGECPACRTLYEYAVPPTEVQ